MAYYRWEYEDYQERERIYKERQRLLTERNSDKTFTHK